MIISPWTMLIFLPLLQIYYVLAILENFLFRILWVFTISLGHYTLNVTRDDIITTVAGVLEILRYMPIRLL